MQDQKDKSIKNLINEIRLRPEFNNLNFVDYHDGDLCATGLAAGDKSIYISTYSYTVLSDCRYDYHLEISDGVRIDQFRVVKEGTSVSLDDLFAEMRRFFEL